LYSFCSRRGQVTLTDDLTGTFADIYELLV
jgi:hypothetical protein